MKQTVKTVVMVSLAVLVLLSGVAPLAAAQEGNTTTTATPTSTPTATPADDTQCDPGPSEPQLAQSRLYAPEKQVSAGSPGRIAGGFQVDPSSECSVVVSITLSVPSGMSISGASDTFTGGAGMAAAQFTVAPGGGIKDISADVYSQNTGDRTVTADITYWPVGHKDLAKEIDGLTFTFDVTQPVTETVEGGAGGAGGDGGDGPGPSLPVSQTTLVIGSLVVLLLAAIVGLAVRGGIRDVNVAQQNK